MNNKIYKIPKLLVVITTAVCLGLGGAVAYGADSNQLSSLAGTGENGYTDGALSSASFNSPNGIAVTKDGGILISDTGNSIIREIKDGKVSVYAGKVDHKDVDDYGFPNGDYVDGDVLSAKFNNQRGIAVNSKGEIFIADTGNNVVRKIQDGKVYTFAGDGKAGYKDGANKEAEFNCPNSIAIDKNDNVFVSDTLNNVIRKITADGNVTTFAGVYSQTGGYVNGDIQKALFNEPSGIAFDSNGNLLVLDSGNQLVREIKNNYVITLAGARDKKLDDTNYYNGDFRDGKKNNARFNFPKGICVTPDNLIIVADTFNNIIRALDEDGNTVTIAGTGETGKASGNPKSSTFSQPTGLAWSNGKLYIADSLNNLIRTMPVSFTKLPKTIASNSTKKVSEDPLKGIKLTKTKDIQIWLNKKLLKFKSGNPYYDASKNILVPLRDVCEAWGAKVSYNAKTQQIIVTKGDFTKTFLKGNVGDLLVNKKSVNYINVKQLAEILSLDTLLQPNYNAVILTDRE